MRDASAETTPSSEQWIRGASTAASGEDRRSRSSTCRIAGGMRSLPGDPIASQGRSSLKTMVGATLAQGTALGLK